jgi:hypothetical protein
METGVHQYPNSMLQFDERYHIWSYRIYLGMSKYRTHKCSSNRHEWHQLGDEAYHEITVKILYVLNLKTTKSKSI